MNDDHGLGRSLLSSLLTPAQFFAQIVNPSTFVSD